MGKAYVSLTTSNGCKIQFILLLLEMRKLRLRKGDMIPAETGFDLRPLLLNRTNSVCKAPSLKQLLSLYALSHWLPSLEPSLTAIVLSVKQVEPLITLVHLTIPCLVSAMNQIFAHYIWWDLWSPRHERVFWNYFSSLFKNHSRKFILTVNQMPTEAKPVT